MCNIALEEFERLAVNLDVHGFGFLVLDLRSWTHRRPNTQDLRSKTKSLMLGYRVETNNPYMLHLTEVAENPPGTFAMAKP